jgi:hypothetical protein
VHEVQWAGQGHTQDRYASPQNPDRKKPKAITYSFRGRLWLWRFVNVEEDQIGRPRFSTIFPDKVSPLMTQQRS